MKAALLRQIPSERLEIESVAEPVVTDPGDLVVEVSACGICGTDLHILAGTSYSPELPFVLGHEPVGTVVAAGERVADRWLGRRVVITLFTGCGVCAQCLRGDERLCANVVSDTGVFGIWGGYAERMAIHAAQAIEVPPALSNVEAASLVDCGATAANAVRVALEYRPQRVAIVGAGPIGFIAAEMLRHEGLLPRVVQSSEPRRRVLAALGYPVVPGLADLEETPDVVIDCAGNASVTNQSIASLAPAGVYIAAGYAVVAQFELPQVARKELTIRGVRSGSRADLVHVMDLAASGRIRLPAVQSWPLDQINEAFTALRERRVPGKAVIVPAE